MQTFNIDANDENEIIDKLNKAQPFLNNEDFIRIKDILNDVFKAKNITIVQINEILYIIDNYRKKETASEPEEVTPKKKLSNIFTSKHNTNMGMVLFNEEIYMLRKFFITYIILDKNHKKANYYYKY